MFSHNPGNGTFTYTTGTAPDKKQKIEAKAEELGNGAIIAGLICRGKFDKWCMSDRALD
jgi:hypothetical protein